MQTRHSRSETRPYGVELPQPAPLPPAGPLRPAPGARSMHCADLFPSTAKMPAPRVRAGFTILLAKQFETGQGSDWPRRRDWIVEPGSLEDAQFSGRKGRRLNGLISCPASACRVFSGAQHAMKRARNELGLRILQKEAPCPRESCACSRQHSSRSIAPSSLHSAASCLGSALRKALISGGIDCKQLRSSVLGLPDFGPLDAERVPTARWSYLQAMLGT